MDRLLVSQFQEDRYCCYVASAFIWVAQAAVLISIFVLFGANIVGGSSSIISIV